MHIKYANTQIMDWDNIRYFLEVVHAGSVSRAAQNLGVNQTTVSRRIASLESDLGAHLFERSGKQWSVTAIGERLVASAANMAEEAQALERQVLSDSKELSGPLRITLGSASTQQLAMPVILAFIQQYPEIELEIIVTGDELNLASREADIALRTTDNPPPNVIGKRIGQLAYGIYGTEAMLEHIHNDPASGAVPCITWQGDGKTRAPWIEKSFPACQHIYRTNELDMMLQMVEQGLGIAQMPCALCDTKPLLYRIPARFVEPGWGLWVLSHVDLRTTARVRIFRDFLITELENKKALIEGRSRDQDETVQHVG